jgi:hypothetical protein
MKHILNNISQEEKNSILEQHSGGMKIRSERFNDLLESKMGNVKPLINETSSLQNMSKEQFESMATSCFNAGKYPTLVKISKTVGVSIAALASIALGVLAVGSTVVTGPAGGVTAGLAFTGAAFGAANASNKASEIIKQEMGKDPKLKQEIEDFVNCLSSPSKW